METLTLMVLPPAGEGSPPTFYFMEKGIWYNVGHDAPEGDLDDLRDEVREELEDHAETPDMDLLKDFCGQGLYEKVVPRDLQTRLRGMVERAGDDPETPPLLTVHSHEQVDWIPWELMYDQLKDAFLGLRFQIARLPIGKISLEPPEYSSATAEEGEPRKVRKVYSVLGEGILAAAEDRLKWRGTFEGLVKPAGERRWPEDGHTEIPDNLLSQMEAPDIIHVTCHAGALPGGEGVAWRLRDGLRIVPGNFGGSMFKVFREQQPLVFANACASAGGLEGLGPSNFGHKKSFPRQFVERLNAKGFVGTFAPVQEGTAVEFAAAFFQFLLKDGHPIAKALWKARTKLGHKDDPSWLFYSLYGHPHTVFEAPKD
jgi:hypothetical protein